MLRYSIKKNLLFFLHRGLSFDKKFCLFLITSIICFYFSGWREILFVIPLFIIIKEFSVFSYNEKITKVFLLFLCFYSLWIIIPAVMHFAALHSLNPLTPITVNGRTNFWGFATVKQTSVLYLLFPVLFIALFCFFLDNQKIYKWLIWIPIIIIPSLLVGLYQGVVDVEFLNSDFWISRQRASGLTNDSNGFGISLFLIMPLCFLSFCFVQRYWKKICFLIIGLFLTAGLIISGSRTGLLGLFLFLLFLPFIWIWVQSDGKSRLNLKKMSFTLSLFFIVAVGVIFCIAQILGSTTLTDRLSDSYANFREGGIEELAHNRVELGLQACRLTALAPMAGFGPGGFWRNLENIRFIKQEIDKKRFNKIRNRFYGFDNANNHYLQMSSELGIVGAFSNVFFHIWPLSMVYKFRKQIVNRRERWMTGVSFSVVCIIMILYLTGPHGMNIDVLWLLAIYLSFLFITALKHGYTTSIFKFKWLAAGFGVLICVSVLGSFDRSFGSNGYKALQDIDWWPYRETFGYYQVENWHGEQMRWTRRTAQETVKPTADIVGYKLVAFPQNSDGQEGLSVNISLNGKTWDEIRIFDGGVRPLYYYLPGVKDKWLEFGIEVNRTFNPRKLGLSDDDRELGVALSPATSLKIMPLDGIGFYPYQIWEGDAWDNWPNDIPIQYRWSGKRATLNLAKKCQKGCRIFLKSEHPDIQHNAAQVTVEQNGQELRKLIFKDNEIKVLSLNKIELFESSFLTLVVDRTWNPRKIGISDDDRDLGIAVAVLEN